MTIIDNSSPYLNDLQYSSKSASDQAEIDALIIAGQELLEEYCSRKFEAATYTDEVYNGTGESVIWVDNPPIRTLTTVKIVCHASVSTNDDTTSYNGTYFTVNQNQGRINFRANRLFPEHQRNVLITYDGGWLADDVPEGLKLALARFVMELYDPTSVPEGLQKEKLGQYFYDKGTDYYNRLPLSQQKILGLYKLRKLF